MTFIKCYTFKNNVHLCILFQTLNYLQYFVCVSPQYCMTLFVILIHHALPVINIVTLWQLVHLSPCSYLKKRFCVGACSDRELNRTCRLILKNKKSENNRKCHASKSKSGFQNCFQNLSQNPSLPFAQISC